MPKRMADSNICRPTSNEGTVRRLTASGLREHDRATGHDRAQILDGCGDHRRRHQRARRLRFASGPNWGCTRNWRPPPSRPRRWPFTPRTGTRVKSVVSAEKTVNSATGYKRLAGFDVGGLNARASIMAAAPT